MSDFVPDNVRGGGRGGRRVVSMEETSANPHHSRVFLTLGGFVAMRRTHSMRHFLERMSGKTMFWKWEGKKNLHREMGDIFGGKMRQKPNTEIDGYTLTVYVNCYICV